MTFGEQNSLPQSFRLLDEAFSAGINFFDSAEMYTPLIPAIPFWNFCMLFKFSFCLYLCYFPVFHVRPFSFMGTFCLRDINFWEHFALFVYIFYKSALCAGNCRYPVPQLAGTHGRSEEYLGRWIRDRKISRDRVILATKVSAQL